MFSSTAGGAAAVFVQALLKCLQGLVACLRLVRDEGWALGKASPNPTSLELLRLGLGVELEFPKPTKR